MDAVLRQVFSIQSLVHALSGLLGGSVAMTIVYPLDQLRLLAQLSSLSLKGQPDATPGGTRLPPADSGLFARARWLVENKGFGELYRGLSATLITTGSANFIYFYMYNGFKNVVQIRTNRPTVGPIVNLVVATMASAINVTATNPLWVTCLKVKTDNDNAYRGSMVRCMCAVVR